MSEKISDLVNSKELELITFKAVAEKYPDAILFSSRINSKRYEPSKKYFASPSVNNSYTNLAFSQSYSTLYMMPYCTLSVPTENGSNTVQIFSLPIKKKIMGFSNYRKSIHFPKLKFNLKNNNFKESIIRDCAFGISECIKRLNVANNFKINYTNLDPKIQKLLTFM